MHDGIRVHLLPRSGLIFSAVALDDVSVAQMQAMLAEIADRFIEEYGTGDEMPTILLPYTMSNFSQCLASIMQRWADQPEPAIGAVKQDLEDLKDILVIDMEKLLVMGDTLLTLQANTQRLNRTALEFQRRSTILRREAWWRNEKLMIGTVMGVVLFLYLAFGLVCGLPNWNHCIPRI